MIKKVQNSAFSKVICFILMLYFINLSIDVQYDKDLPYTVNYNEQESIIEFVIEKVLKYDNAIPEVDDEDIDKRKPIKNDFSLFPTIDYLFSLSAPPLGTGKEQHNFHINPHHQNLEYKIPTPPPEFVTAW